MLVLSRACRDLLQFCRLLFALSLLAACSDHSVDVETFLPEPEWIDSIKLVELSSADEVTQLWQSKERCCIAKAKLRKNQREFYKACYVAVARNPDDENLVAKCLQLMVSGMDSTVRKQIYEHYVSNYFYFESPIDRCYNCLPADPIANVSHDLARLEFRSNNAHKAIDVVKNVLNARLEEISPFVQMKLYADLADFYTSTGYSDEELNILLAARDRLRAHVKPKGASKHNFKNLERNIGELMEG